MIFLDSNVWIYGFISAQDPEKHIRATELTKLAGVLVSQQVVAEVCYALIRKLKIPEARIREVIEEFEENYSPLALETIHYLHASHLRERYHFSHWDSLLIAAALELKATIFYSEDLHHGLIVEGTLSIINPFKR